MSAARQLAPHDEQSDGPLLRLYRGYLEQTGSEIAAAIFALDAHHSGRRQDTQPIVEPAYLTVKQAAQQLQVSERTVARMIDCGLRVIRAGKTVRIKPADLEEYLAEQDTRFD